jgi:hypothetical protein
MQRGLRLITLLGAIEKSPILLSQYWKNEWFDGNIIISYFGGSNIIFADCMHKFLNRWYFLTDFLIIIQMNLILYKSNLIFTYLWSEKKDSEGSQEYKYSLLLNYSEFHYN